MIRIFRVLPVFIFSILIFSISGWPQSSRFDRERNIDVRHYVIRTSFVRDKKMVLGDTTVSLKPLVNNLKTVELDAVSLDFESVRLDPSGIDLKYLANSKKISITLDRDYTREELISIRFKYSAKPTKGIYFIDALEKDGKIVRESQIWTQGESEESRHWFPSFDFPDDKATSEQFITVEKGETAIGNGHLLELRDTPEGKRTFHFKMPVVHSTYLTSFIVGTYTKVEDKYGEILLGFYVYPQKTAIVPLAFGKTKDMLRVFEELTGVKYPFDKYDQTIVAQFSFGGMENITATTFSDMEVLLADNEFAQEGVMDLVSHEMAHSWFGNLVTCKNWSELWLNEGFATFMEAAYRERLFGREDYIRKITEDADQYIISDSYDRKPHGLLNLRADPNNDDSMFDTITYQKGGAVIHTLREAVGNTAFWKGVSIYLERHKYDNARSSDLRNAMEEASKMDLGWFFKQWVAGGGFPKLEVRKVYNSKRKILELTVSQTQKADSLTPAVFILPINVQIKTEKGVKTEAIRITKRNETFVIGLKNRPIDIVLDSEQKIPIKLVKYQALTLRSR